MSDQGNIEERLEHYAKRAMPHYPNDLCSEAKREIERLRTILADCSEERTIDSVPSCGQENDHRKARPLKYPCKHELSEDCPACMQEEIERLRAEVDTLKTAITAPTKEEIDLRAQLDEASGETVRVQHELGELLHWTEAQLASARKALEPFAACVFNDNGEVTITTSDLRVHDYVRARSALTDETG